MIKNVFLFSLCENIIIINHYNLLMFSYLGKNKSYSNQAIILLVSAVLYSSLVSIKIENYLSWFGSRPELQYVNLGYVFRRFYCSVIKKVRPTLILFQRLRSFNFNPIKTKVVKNDQTYFFVLVIRKSISTVFSYPSRYISTKLQSYEIIKRITIHWLSSF